MAVIILQTAEFWALRDRGIVGLWRDQVFFSMYMGSQYRWSGACASACALEVFLICYVSIYQNYRQHADFNVFAEPLLISGVCWTCKVAAYNDIHNASGSVGLYNCSACEHGLSIDMYSVLLWFTPWLLLRAPWKAQIWLLRIYYYTSLFTIMVAENKKSKRLNKLQQCEAKQLN